MARLAIVVGIVVVVAAASVACLGTLSATTSHLTLSWVFDDGATCTSVGVTTIAVTATNDDGAVTSRSFPCDAGAASMLIPAGEGELHVRAVDAEETDDDDESDDNQDVSYSATVLLNASSSRVVDLGPVTLSRVVPGDVLVQVVIDRLCAADVHPHTLVVTVDNALAAAPVSPVCGFDAHFAVFDLAPGRHRIAVLGFDDEGRMLFGEAMTTVVVPGMVVVVVVDIGVSDVDLPEKDVDVGDRGDVGDVRDVRYVR